MAGSTVPAGDSTPELPVPVTALTAIAQQVIKQARQDDRQALWNAYQQALAAEQERSPQKYPWESASAVLSLSMDAATRPLVRLVTTAQGLAGTEEAHRLRKIAQAEARKLEQSLTPDNVPARPPRHCAHCGDPIPPRLSSQAKYCKPAHRVAAFNARQAAKASTA